MVKSQALGFVSLIEVERLAPKASVVEATWVAWVTNCTRE